MAFLSIPDHRRISKLHGINEQLGNKSTPPQPISQQLTGSQVMAPLQLCARTVRVFVDFAFLLHSLRHFYRLPFLFLLRLP